jgi:hypothetical protein
MPVPTQGKSDFPFAPIDGKSAAQTKRRAEARRFVHLDAEVQNEKII